MESIYGTLGLQNARNKVCASGECWKIQMEGGRKGVVICVAGEGTIKLRVFLWRLARHSLLSADVLHHRNMVDHSRCTLCGVADSWRHSLLSAT